MKSVQVRKDRIRSVTRDLAHAHPVNDLALWSAGLTFFAAIGLVPLLMEAVALGGRIAGESIVRERAAELLGALPNSNSAPAAMRSMVDASLGLSWPNIALLLVPTTVYGEGFRRSFLQMSLDRPRRSTGWRGRLAFLPIIALAPIALLAIVATVPFVAPLYARGGWGLAAGVVVSFHITFVLLTVVLGAIYGVVGTVSMNGRSLALASACAASLVAGFLHGFVLFLAIPISWSAGFGDLPGVGAISVLALWLYGLHVVVIVGYRLALVLDRVSS